MKSLTESSRESNAPGEVRLRRATAPYRHPWVYRRMVKSSSPALRDGDEVIVRAADGSPLGRGMYSERSMIAVRMFSADASEALDRAFLTRRIAAAVRLRTETLELPRRTNAYRLVNSEGDGLSGAIVDRYADLVVIEFFSKALFLRRHTIRAVLQELLPEIRVVFRTDREALLREGMELPAEEVEELDRCDEVEIHEGKVRFLVSPRGHKTGFFLDQREQRQRFASLVRGLKVLDAFSYTGGFAIPARTVGKARRVVAVELDEHAVAMGQRNARRNRAEIEWVHSDVFHYLRAQRHAVEPFEAIVLDPPKWALRRAALEEAERKYLDLNTAAIQALRRGGILVTCSCSGLVGEGRFLAILRRAARDAGRTLQVLHLGGAGADHPFLIDCPESRYLSAVFARVG